MQLLLSVCEQLRQKCVGDVLQILDLPENLVTCSVLEVSPAFSLSNDSLSVLGDDFVNFLVLPVQPLEG
jgi:hypothetical protein